jgi:hypothetical protein
MKAHKGEGDDSISAVEMNKTKRVSQRLSRTSYFFLYSTSIEWVIEKL